MAARALSAAGSPALAPAYLMKESACRCGQVLPARMESRTVVAIRVGRGASRTCAPYSSSSPVRALALRQEPPLLQAHSIALPPTRFWASGIHQKLQSYFFPSLHPTSQKQFCRFFRIKAAHARTLSRGQSSKSKSKQLQAETNECLNWWEEKMEQLRKPAAKELTKRLNYTNLLGLDDNLKNGSFREGSLNVELLEVKAKYPREVLLCRIGEFYEAVGFDACVLVEYASLNPMSGLRSDTVPRAGCPVMNLRQTLDALTSSGFSVCVYEEVKAPTQARQRKERFISGHAHPGSPYVYGLAEANIDLDVSEEVFVVGISKSARGYCLVSVSEMMRTFSVEDGLTEEAVVAKLRAKVCYYFFIHRSLQDASSGVVRWGEYGEGGLLWAECKGKSCEWFDHDPVSQVISKVKNLYDLDSKEEFREVVFPSKGRPKPLHVGTAAQIGILPTVGVPSLLKVLLPTDCTILCRVYLRDLLLNPPPPQIATSIQAACRLMASVTTAIPDSTCVSAAKLVKLISSKEVNHIEFSRIRSLAEDVIWMHKDQQLSPILTYLLDPTSLATGLKYERQHLVSECIHLIAQLDNVLAAEEDPEQRFSSFWHIPDDFFQCMECSWRGRVRRELADSFYEEVQKAAEDLNTAVEDEFVPILMHVRATDASVAGAPKADIIFSRDHEAVWLKVCKFSATSVGTSEAKLFKDLLPAEDGKGKRVREDLYTTARVEMALERYKGAVLKATCRVYEVLRSLADDLKGNLNTVVFISVLAVIGKTLFAHVSEARRRNWTFPELFNHDAQLSMKHDNQSIDNLNVDLSQNSNKRVELVFHNLIPYWVDKAHTLAVSNSVKMSSLHLLTGPNGGGKSSILRSIGAATLLGICGLMVPAASAGIPRFDAVMLRMMPQDSPADAKSSFQMEMSELRTILHEVTNRSLVLVDELCRGTEVQKGTAIAASVIEFLDSAGCTGLLSTHLHGLLDMKLNVKSLVHKAMGTKIENGVLKPTWKMVDGCCRESLAFETARREGVPEFIVQRAEQLYLAYHDSHQKKEYIPELVLQGNVQFSRNQTEMKGNALEDEGNSELNSEILRADCNGSINISGGIEDGLQVETHDSSKTGMYAKPVDNAVHIFLNICKRKILEMQRGGSPSEDVIVFTRVGVREQPPPAAINRSCVYLMFRPDGKFYVGQTDNITGRIKAHRTKQGLQKAPFVYVQVANKSIASELETLLINQLPQSGIELVNKSDQHHRHFGTEPAVHSQLPF